MSVITAVGSDGESLIYLEGEGVGTFASPFKPKYVADGGNHYVAGIATQEEALTAITAGSELVVKLDPTGRMYVSQKPLTSVKDSVTSHQGGAWTVAIEQSSINALTVLPSDAAKASNQSRIPGLDIPQHDWIQIVEDSAGELISVTYRLGNTVVSTLNFTYSDYTFVGPNRTTTIEKS